MKRVQMTRERVMDIISIYGASPSRWPDSERDEAMGLVATFADLQADLDRALALDEWLDAAPVCEPSQELISNIFALRPKPGRAASGSQLGGMIVEALRALGQVMWPNRSPVFPALAFAGSAALGVLIVLASPTTFGVLFSSPVEITREQASTGEQLLALALVENEYPDEWKSSE